MAYRRESDLVKDVIKSICAEPECWARKVHGGPHGAAGEPDVDAVVRGRSVKLEGKMPGKVPTPGQYAAMRRWSRAGALVGWFTTLDEAWSIIAHAHDYGWINPQMEETC